MLQSNAPITEPTPRRWTREEYYRVAQTGVFDGQRVELIDGRILAMSPQTVRHANTIAKTLAELMRAFAGKAHVRPQLPLRLLDGTEPEPDLAVIPGSPDDYTDHPARAELVVEVADSSLAFDRTTKASLYAAAGIGEYWLINLKDHQVEVHREPTADTESEFGHRYATLRTVAADGQLTPQAAPDAVIAVKAVLA